MLLSLQAQHDVPLADIAPIVLDAKPKYLSIEACNPGHGHEWDVWRTVPLPALAAA